MKTLICITALAFGVLLYVGIIIQDPVHYKISSAEVLGAEYLGDDDVVFQKKFNDCGPSALRMVFDNLGIITSHNEIEQMVPLTKRGATMLDLESAAEQKGLILEGWNLSVDSLSTIAFPAILLITQNHYIVADSLVMGKLYFRDPSIGRLRIPLNKMDHIWNGEALVIHLQKK